MTQSIVHLDFETRSELDIWKVGAWNYSVHPSTEILCMAYCFDKDPIQIRLTNDLKKYNHVVMSSYNPFENKNFQNAIFTAHYSMFENYIWHNILVKRYGWPELPLRQWRCTAALVATHALPRALKNTPMTLGLSERKDMEGHRIMLKVSKPRKITKNNKAKWHEDPEDFQKLYKYCIQDVNVERAIDNTLPKLSPQEQEVWFLDQKINTRGIQVDTELVDSALYLIEKFTEEQNSKLKKITGNYLDKASQVARFKNWMETRGVVLPDLTKDSVTKALADGKHPEVLEALKIRQQIGKTSVKKFQAFKNATCSDGRVRDMFVYHGASTGRWTGKIVQLHNLPRGTIKDTENCIKVVKWNNLEKFKFLYPKVMDAISSCVRGALIAAPGKDLLVVDFAAIEARVLAWIAGEKIALEEFRTGVDSYVKMAEAIFETKDIDSKKRFVGKQTVLGCGYGMGSVKFQGTCEGLGQVVSNALAKKAVYTFRKKNKKIVQLWKKIEQSAINTVKIKVDNPEIGVSFAGNKIKFFMDKERDFLYCQLPSGRKLAYHHPKIERVEFYDKMVDQLSFMGVGKNSTYIRQTTWGGTLVENIVQAIARDLLTEAMLRVEKHGYKIVLHVHDEIVVEVRAEKGVPRFYGEDECWGFQSLEDFISLTTELPAWAEGCPIKAEGFRTRRYRKE